MTSISHNTLLEHDYGDDDDDGGGDDDGGVYVQRMLNILIMVQAEDWLW